MKLEVLGISNVKLVEKYDLPAGTINEIDNDFDEECFFANKDMTDGLYENTDATTWGRVTLGPPSREFDRWADTLSRFAYQVPFSDVAKDPTPFQGKAFFELLACSEQFNAVGTATATKLAQNFAANKDAARQFGETLGDKDWFHNYERLEKVFQLGSQNGIVKLYLSKDITGAQAQPDGILGAIEVKLLGPKVALVLDSLSATDVNKNDIVLLSYDPGEGAGLPNVTKIALRPKPISSDIPYYTPEQLNRMLALAAVLGCDIDSIEKPPADMEGIDPGIITVSHDGRVDILKIALNAGVSFPDHEHNKVLEEILD